METIPWELLTARWGRARGLLGRARDLAWHVLMPCDDVHTVGMGHDLDIAFLDREGKVLASHHRVKSCRRLRCRGAAGTVERFAQESGWLEPGDRLGLTVIRRGDETKRDEREEER